MYYSHFLLQLSYFKLSCKKSSYAQSPSYVLHAATTSTLGGVIPDGTTISVDVNGKISTVNTGSSVRQQNKIIFSRNYPLTGNSGLFYGAIWTANYDGTNQQKINITLPAGLFVSYQASVKLSPDQKTIFFYVDDVKQDANGPGYYSCNIDGSNPKLIIASTGSGDLNDVGAAY